MRIKTKDQFQQLSRAGLLGNFLRQWDTLLDLTMSDYSGWLTIRARAKQSEWFIAAVESGMVRDALRNILLRGGPPASAFFFQEIPEPGTPRMANIEAMRDAHRHTICYIENDTTEPVRGIRDRCLPVYGAAALMQLRRFLSPTSYDDLQAIWDQYPDAIIEATEFAVPVGVFHRPLVIWEARDY